ncbi:unnamed protein product, partial [Meganyctiphanes norvegica]
RQSNGDLLEFFSYYAPNFHLKAALRYMHLQVITQDVRFTFDSPLAPKNWNHICFSYNHENQKVRSYIAGHVSKAKKDYNWWNHELKHNKSHLCLGNGGKGANKVSQDGWMAGFYVIPKVIVKPTMRPGSCETHSHAGSIIDLHSSWHKSKGAKIINFTMARVCEDMYVLIVIQKNAFYKEHEQMCSSINGHLMKDGELYSKSDSETLDTCVADGEYLAWSGYLKTKGRPEKYLCPSILRNGTFTHKRSCTSQLSCSACIISRSYRFKMYGAIEGFDREFFLQPMPGKNWVLNGTSWTSAIVSTENGWRLQSNFHDIEWYLNKSMPTGRNIWHYEGKEKLLTVTACNNQEFCCNDGECINRQNRCDGVIHCSDQSDEV